MKINDLTCFLCDKKLKSDAHTLKDSKKKLFGVYCSKECLDMDAWGPRFRPKHFSKKVSISKAKELLKEELI